MYYNVGAFLFNLRYEKKWLKNDRQSAWCTDAVSLGEKSHACGRPKDFNKADTMNSPGSQCGYWWVICLIIGLLKNHNLNL